MTDGPELEAVGLPAMEGGRCWFCMGCDPVLMLSGLLTCCDMFPATCKQLNVTQKKNPNICVRRFLCGVTLWYKAGFILIKCVISTAAYKFRPVGYFQACSYAAVYLRADTLSPHFTEVMHSCKMLHTRKIRR
jgi:hypothetical protein